MAEPRETTFRSGDALFAFDSDLTIVAWNRAAEELTGISAEDAIGRECWEVIGGCDEHGNLVCHRGCSAARLAREGWPVRSQGLLIKTQGERRRVELSTLAVVDGPSSLFLHVIAPRGKPASPRPSPSRLTPRQREVLELLADGVPAKVIATRLGLAEATVRNHIRSIFLELGTHSQLETIAKAHRLRLLSDA